MAQGWCIIKQDDEVMEGVPSRIGWGQATIEQAQASGPTLVNAGTVFITKEIDPQSIENPISFRLCYDGQDPVTGYSESDGEGKVPYEGVISLEWLDGDEDLAFAPLEFGQADVGATDMYYRKGEKWELL